jgi:hypothetical protein
MFRRERKWPAIDLIKLYTAGNTTEWNDWLTLCLANQNLNELSKRLYGIQAGMDDLVKQKLDTEDLRYWFVRLQRSIEKTAKKIFRQKWPNPCDDPYLAKSHKSFRDVKRKRDKALEDFLRGSSY